MSICLYVAYCLKGSGAKMPCKDEASVATLGEKPVSVHSSCFQQEYITEHN